NGRSARTLITRKQYRGINQKKAPYHANIGLDKWPQGLYWAPGFFHHKRHIMATSAVAAYGDYIHQPNCEKLDHIPGDFGLPVLGHTFSYLKDPLPWTQERYKKYGLLQKVSTTGTKGLLALGPDLVQQVLLDTERNFSSKM